MFAFRMYGIYCIVYHFCVWPGLPTNMTFWHCHYNLWLHLSFSLYDLISCRLTEYKPCNTINQIIIEFPMCNVSGRKRWRHIFGNQVWGIRNASDYRKYFDLFWWEATEFALEDLYSEFLPNSTLFLQASTRNQQPFTIIFTRQKRGAVILTGAPKSNVSISQVIDSSVDNKFEFFDSSTILPIVSTEFFANSICAFNLFDQSSQTFGRAD